MPSKYIYIVLALTILIQLAFSFYFSNEIINQNQLYQNNSNKIFHLNQEVESLENAYSRLTSINELQKISTPSAFVPINQAIDLNNLKH